MMGKIVYITAKAPFGSEEAFIIPEMIALKRLGVDLIIIPRDKGKNIFHKEAESLVNDTLSIPWFNIRIFLYLLKFIIVHPLRFINLLNIIFFKARNTKIGFKNLAIFPKALYISKVFKKHNISHIHAHWASTTATMAFIISNVTGVPWSFTTHRWDITENNLLKEKCITASFVRAINEEGKREILEIVKDKSLENKILVIHMGVEIPENNNGLNKLERKSKNFNILCPANLVPVKGHKYLFEACRILLDRGFRFNCLVAGSGPLENELKELVLKLNLNSAVKFLGKLPHEKLLSLYRKNLINVVVLPSILSENGEKEGIPVALMEAMSYGIPVISTNIGGIPELIGDGSGIMVDEKNPEAIANGIENLMRETWFYDLICNQGREKIQKEFNINLISKKMLNLFLNSHK
jgi:glycosyltransferase involved in cell wall biosynthesis